MIDWISFQTQLGKKLGRCPSATRRIPLFFPLEEKRFVNGEENILQERDPGRFARSTAIDWTLRREIHSVRGMFSPLYSVLSWTNYCPDEVRFDLLISSLDGEKIDLDEGGGKSLLRAMDKAFHQKWSTFVAQIHLEHIEWKELIGATDQQNQRREKISSVRQVLICVDERTTALCSSLMETSFGLISIGRVSLMICRLNCSIPLLPVRSLLHQCSEDLSLTIFHFSSSVQQCSGVSRIFRALGRFPADLSGYWAIEANQKPTGP